MNAIELISKIYSGEIKEGTTLRYIFEDSSKNVVAGECKVDRAGINIGLFDGSCSISTVTLINSSFSIV